MYTFPLKDVPRPGSLAFRASWPSSGPGLTLGITQDTPPQVSGPMSIWKTFDRPGSQGQGLIDPEPNPYLASSGSSIFFDIPSPGAPLITSRTFSKDGAISVEAVMQATFPNGGYAGPVIYCGESRYLAIYLVPHTPTLNQVALFTPDFSTAILPFTVGAGEVVALRADYYQGTGLLYLNGQLIDVRTFSTIGMPSDPHAALFLCGKGNVGRFDVFTS